MSELPQSAAEAGERLYRLVAGRHGRFLINPMDRYIGSSMIEYGEWSELEVQTLVQAVPVGGVVVEVGANIGTHTIPLARKLGAGGRLHAYEPQPVVFQNLCANLALNDLRNVYAYNMALGKERGSIMFPDLDYARPGNFGGIGLGSLPASDRGQRIEIAPLDEAELPVVNLLKIDAEGMEADVVEGARQTIARCRPVLYMENDDPNRSEPLIRMLDELGYRQWWHLPALFNPRNAANNTVNHWPGTVSCNMLAVHRSVNVNVGGMPEILDPSAHPLRKAA